MTLEQATAIKQLLRLHSVKHSLQTQDFGFFTVTVRTWSIKQALMPYLGLPSMSFEQVVHKVVGDFPFGLTKLMCLTVLEQT